MKFALAIIPAFLTLSAFGSPIELDARQRQPKCNFTRCLETVALQFTGIRACAAALKNLDNIREAQTMGKPPRQGDLEALEAIGGKCLVEAIN